MCNLNIGVIGCGYWGPNLVRNFSQLERVKVIACCDLNIERLNHIKQLYPHIEMIKDYRKLIDNPKIDVICVATPAPTHYKIALYALNKGKHVLIEKPITVNTIQAQRLINLAKKKKRTIMVGHTFEYSPAINKIKEIIATKEIGKILYIYSIRVNLGIFQKDINVIWDLAPHDISILNYLLGSIPKSVSAVGASHIHKGIEDVGFVTLNYPNKGIIAHLHLSWLDPCKIRRMVIVGTKKMVVYDDLSLGEPIKIYNKRVTRPPYYDSFGEFKLLYKFGDTHSPRIENVEPLKIECQHFIDCIRQNKAPQSDGRSGLRVVKVIEAAQRSLRYKGKTKKVT